ncbi:uncharacterized protein LOC117821650 [Notolabrus celidotus]|uniref:uncharacterized protein LOC117821650 n=1 Tax=Notolabrus celidotus TaxID=1203425 RepID=UPI00148F552A|nr:uncharacterized protein LOC117821650 [Notolabrus celidotus]
MSAATASIADVSKANFINSDDGRDRSITGQSRAQCAPRPLPALGTHRVIQGNGTNVGTVIFLQCPAKHKLFGGELMCVLLSNSTQWVGEAYCKPLSLFEDFGFRIAVLASIVSLAIIFIMSMAFITCCLLDCVKEDKREKQERDPDMWQWTEQAQQPEDNRSHHSHKGRNNNNNNTQEKLFSLWDTGVPAPCDNVQACRYHQQYIYGPTSTCGSSSLVSALPGCDYDEPLLPRNQGYAQSTRQPPQYVRRPQSSFQSVSPGPGQIPEVGPGVLWQYGGPQTSLSGGHPPSTDETCTSNTKKEFSIRIISV